VLKQLFIVLLMSAIVPAQVGAPERKVAGSTITSERDPQVKIQLPSAAHYVGASRWDLYDVADCELHAWVEANPQKRVQRLYWVQFEGYLPSKPDLTHTYDSPRHATIGGLDFYVDTWVRSKDAEVRPGSDREHIEALVRDKGYSEPSGMMYVRLVHLLDPQKRKELMIIYGEDLAPTGFSAADLDEKGKEHDKWGGIESGLIQRAKEKIEIQEPGNR
jgi:hypothetical protein